MTTTVIIKAHCDSETKCVEIKVDNDPCSVSEKGMSDMEYLEDGDVKEISVYDEMSVTVKEVEK